MTDHGELIDAETWAFIERTYRFYPRDASDYSVARQREVYDRMCREFFAGYPDGVMARTVAIGLDDRHLALRIYKNAGPPLEPVVLYFHGGGLIVGGLDSHDDVCAEICQRTGFETVSVDYRLCPEDPPISAFDDSLAAFHWAVSTYSRPVLLCGDSAGGRLAAAVAHATRAAHRQPIGQVLIYPGLGGDPSKGSYIAHADAPLLTARDVSLSRQVRDSVDPARKVIFEPLSDPDFTGLPPTVIITAECDPLSSDGEAYRDRILSAGGKAVWHEEKGLVHGYLRARHTVERARRSFTRIVDALSLLGQCAPASTGFETFRPFKK